MEQVKIVKVVNVGDTYTDKSGKEHTRVNYYCVYGDTWIAFRPSFAKGYTQLDMIAEVRKNNSKKEGN